MVKVVSGVFVGFFSILLAIYFGFLFISGQKDGSSPSLLIPAFFLILVGGYSFFKVIKILTAPKQANNIETLALEGVPAPVDNDQATSILKRNNELVSEYKKTTDTQDKLKMLQISGATEGQNTPG